MSEGHCEARIDSRRENAKGVFITFLVHPDEVSKLDGLRAGSTVVLGWAETVNTEVEAIDVPDNRAAKGDASKDAPRENANAQQVAGEIWQATIGKDIGHPKPKRAFKDMPLSQQAALRSTDQQFARFLETRWNEPCKPEHQAEWIRMECCGIKSRAELDTNAEAARLWRNLEGHFQSWLLTRKYADVLR